MITQDLLDYIKNQNQAGIAKHVIEQNLMDNGWKAADLSEAYDALMKDEQLQQVNQSFHYRVPDQVAQPVAALSEQTIATVEPETSQPEEFIPVEEPTFKVHQPIYSPSQPAAKELKVSQSQTPASQSESLSSDIVAAVSNQKPAQEPAASVQSTQVTFHQDQSVEKVNSDVASQQAQFTHGYTVPAGGSAQPQVQNNPTHHHQSTMGIPDTVRQHMQKKSAPVQVAPAADQYREPIDEPKVTDKSKEEPRVIKPVVNAAMQKTDNLVQQSASQKATLSPAGSPVSQAASVDQNTETTKPSQAPQNRFEVSSPNPSSSKPDSKQVADEGPSHFQPARPMNQATFNQQLIQSAKPDATTLYEAQDTTKPAKRSGVGRLLKIIAVFVVIVGVIFGGLVYAHYQKLITLPLGLPTKGPSSDQVFQRMLEQLLVGEPASAFEYALETSFDLPDDAIALGLVNAEKAMLRANGVYTRGPLGEPLLSMDFAIGQGTAQASGELRVLSDMLLGRLTEVPLLGVFDLSKLDSIWLRFGMDDLQTRLMSDLEAQELKVFRSNLSAIDQATAGAFITALAQSGAITQVEQIGAEQFRGRDVFDYRVGLDDAALRSFLVTQSGAQTGGYVATQLDQLAQMIDIRNLELVVGQDDAKIYQVVTSFAIRSVEFSDTITVDATLGLWNYNQPQAVAVPQTETVSIQQAADIFGSSNIGLFNPATVRQPFVPQAGVQYMIDIGQALSQAGQQVQDDVIRAELATVPSHMRDHAIVSENSFLGGCTTYQPIVAVMRAISTASLAAVPECRDSAASWIAFARLSDGRYSCVDSTGSQGDLFVAPTSLTCISPS